MKKTILIIVIIFVFIADNTVQAQKTETIQKFMQITTIESLKNI